jgi:stage II sporulation protein AA (anti-sigma F factor antagonist)
MHDDEPAGVSGPPAADAAAPFVLTGDIDIATAPRFAADLTAYCGDTTGDVVVDCSHMTFIDSSGLAVFETVRRELAASGRELVLIGVVRHCRRAFEIIGLADLLADAS